MGTCFQRKMFAKLSVLVLVALALSLGTCHANDADFEAFMKWFAQRGGEASQLRLANFEGMGTGLLAVKQVRESDAVIKVPLSLVACRETILKSASPRVLAELEALQDDAQLLGTFLVQQFALKEKSDWYPYLKVLPKNIPLPFTLPDSELDEFQDASAASHARRLRARVTKDFDEVKALIIRVLEDSGLSSTEIGSVPIQDLYVQAITLIDSRALTIQGKKYLVPMADMFNYSPHSEARTADRGSHFLKYHILSKNSFTVLADREAAPGEQLFEDYGDNDNSVYAHHHGFVANNNPFECVAPKLPPLRKNDKRFADKKKLADILRLSSNQQACFRPGPVDALPRSVMDWLYLVNMTPTGVQKCQRILDGERTRGALDECLGDPYSVASLERLQSALKEQASGFPTTVSFDTGLLNDTRLSAGRRLAVSYRLSKKQALLSVLDSVDKHLKRVTGAKKKVKADKLASAPQASSTSSDGLAKIVKDFNEWFLASHPPVAKIQAVLAPDGMRLGTNAVANIAAEEVYLSVPTSVIMDVSSAFNSGIAPLLQKLRQRFNNGDAFHELLFHLMHETFQSPKMGQVSHWKPYIDTLPTTAELDFPVFYSVDELKELQASSAKPTIEKYQSEIKNKFSRIQKLLKEFPGYLDDDVFTYENYRWAHAILDSRAIWWGGERHLVPMLDLINCVEGPDPSRVHSTVLDPSGKHAVTKAPWAFKSGEQLFENYGQPNHIYFSYHGFVLDNNTHDCVVLPLGINPVDSPDIQAAVEARLKAANFRPNYNPCLTASSYKPSDLEYISVARGVSEKVAVKELSAIARKQLAAYATTAAQDEELLRQGGKSWRFTMTTKLRLSEKRLLEKLAALDAVTEVENAEL